MRLISESFIRSRQWVIQLTALLLATLACTILPGAPTSTPTGLVESEEAQNRGNDVDKAKIRALIDLYAKSVSDADTSLASRVWWNSPEVTFIHPQGHEHGFEQIKQDVFTHLMGETFSERRLTVHDVAIHVHGDSAWAEFYWDFAAKLRNDGSPVATHGRETQVYWKMQDGWRLVHVHYSGMPVAAER